MAIARLSEVRDYWNEHPLHSYELGRLGTPGFFDDLDRIKRSDIEKFAIPFWAFDAFRGKRVLDIGSGPGWFTVQYALGGAKVTAIDLTPRAVELTRKYLELKKLRAEVQEASAENLPFQDKGFDLVLSAGVLHHTPNPLSAFRECFRVLRPGGSAKMALYHKGVLHSPVLFAVTRTLMKLWGVKHPGADLPRTAKDPDDFIRQYDGAGNPVGIGKTTAEWSRDLKSAGFSIARHELHYFPTRFIPFQNWIPGFFHHGLDRAFGALIYFDLIRPV